MCKIEHCFVDNDLVDFVLCVHECIERNDRSEPVDGIFGAGSIPQHGSGGIAVSRFGSGLGHRWWRRGNQQNSGGCNGAGKRGDGQICVGRG